MCVSVFCLHLSINTDYTWQLEIKQTIRDPQMACQRRGWRTIAHQNRVPPLCCPPPVTGLAQLMQQGSPQSSWRWDLLKKYCIPCFYLAPVSDSASFHNDIFFPSGVASQSINLSINLQSTPHGMQKGSKETGKILTYFPKNVETHRWKILKTDMQRSTITKTYQT